MKILNISLVVPLNCSEKILNLFFKNLKTWTCLPKEIILINTNKNRIKITRLASYFHKKIKLKLHHYPNFYPGAARNIGVANSSYDIVCFLDIGTYASKNWLQSGYKKLKRNKKCFICWGNTHYLANTDKDKIIRASTYGEKPLQTLPGSIILKKTFSVVGLFLEQIRAGEDAEWIYRVQLHKIKTCKNNNLILYQNLLGASYLSIIKKWFRNYSFSRRLSYLNNNREFYFLTLSFFAVLLAFNWNPLFTSWGQDGYEEDLYYIPHVTKMTSSFLLVTYFFLRGIYLPIKKNVNIKFLFPLNLFKILFLSFLIDMTKLISFIYSRFKEK